MNNLACTLILSSFHTELTLRPSPPLSLLSTCGYNEHSRVIFSQNSFVYRNICASKFIRQEERWFEITPWASPLLPASVTHYPELTRQLPGSFTCPLFPSSSIEFSSAASSVMWVKLTCMTGCTNRTMI